MIRLLAAAAAFTGTVIGGFVVGLVLARATHAEWLVAVGLLVGLAGGVIAIAAALRPFLRPS